MGLETRLHFPEGTDPVDMHTQTVEVAYALRDLYQAVAEAAAGKPLLTVIHLGGIQLKCDYDDCPVKVTVTDMAVLPEGWVHRGIDHFCPEHKFDQLGEQEEKIPFVAVGNEEIQDIKIDEEQLAKWVQENDVKGDPETVRKLYVSLMAIELRKETQ